MSRFSHPLAALALVALALVALAASAYAQTNPGNPSDPANQPATTPPSEQPATDRGDSSASGNSSAQSGPMTAPSAAREQNTRLAAVVPPGMSTREACDGFKGVKECATALHAARNLDIAFADLKSKLTAGERLTSALNELKPGVDAKSEVEKAERQAGMDLRSPQG